MNKFKNYILVLPSWYPSKVDLFNGDFNERLVKSVSKYRRQIVLYIVSTKDQSSIEIITNDNSITYLAYYHKHNIKFFNFWGKFFLYFRLINKIFYTYGLPILVHTYVFFPAGAISYYLKYRYGLKTILTEHWSIFNRVSPQFIEKQNFLKKIIYHKILRSFDCVISVSKGLQYAIDKWTPNSLKYVMPNVVDTDFFNIKNVDLIIKDRITFIHVSDLSSRKNILGILNVFIKLIDSGRKLDLIIVGKSNNIVDDFIKTNHLYKEYIILLGELPYFDVAKLMKVSDVFILFSRNENMPCVILEALCCGLPIISSNVGGISEVINKKNGILVESENKSDLEEAMLWMINNYTSYNRISIASEATNSFNYDKIGQNINEIYLKFESKTQT